MRSLLTTLFIPLLALQLACADPFSAAQTQDTIEAYETFLAQNESSPFRIQAETRLEELYLEKARTSGSLEAYDIYLQKFPKGRLVEKGTEERREFLFGWADSQDTPEAWQKFLDEYPSGNRKMKDKARKRMRMAEHRSEIGVGPVETRQVNLAEDPEGPLDGWGFYVDVTNNGTQPLEMLMMRIRYLDDAGKSLDEKDWPVCAKRAPGGLPQVESFYLPLKPGETRTWEWTTGDMPAGWSKKVQVVPVDLKFVNEEESKEE